MPWPISFFQDPLRRSIGLRPAVRRHRAPARRLCFEPLEDRLALSSSPVAPPTPLHEPYEPGGAIGPPEPILLAIEAAVPVQPAISNPNVIFPTNPYQEASTPYGLSGIFTDTGLPHAYEDEQLLAGQRVIANRPIRDLTPPGALTPASPSKPAQDQQPAHHRRADDVRPKPPVVAQPPHALGNSRLALEAAPSRYGHSGRLGAEAAQERAAVDAVMAALDEMRVVSDGLYLTGTATGANLEAIAAGEW